MSVTTNMAVVQRSKRSASPLFPSDSRHNDSINLLCLNLSPIKKEIKEELSVTIYKGTEVSNSTEVSMPHLPDLSASMQCLPDLPVFTGEVKEWLLFKAMFEESTNIYKISAEENRFRLKKCLRGKAYSAVWAMMYYLKTDPSEIIQTLERYFWRPNIFIHQTFVRILNLRNFNNLKTEPSPEDIIDFSVKLYCHLTTIAQIDRRYLQNPVLTRFIEQKLTPNLKALWREYAKEHRSGTEPTIVKISNFLRNEEQVAVKGLIWPVETGPQRPRIFRLNYWDKHCQRSEQIIDEEIKKLRNLPRIEELNKCNVIDFIRELNKIVTVITYRNGTGYFWNPKLIQDFLDKLHPLLVRKWYRHAKEFQTESEPEIVAIARFLTEEVDDFGGSSKKYKVSTDHVLTAN